MLSRAFGMRRVLFDYVHDPVDPATPAAGELARHTDPRRLRNVRAIHGHFPIQKYDVLENCVRAVLLREPVDNVISIYFYWLHLIESGHLDGHALFAAFVAERPGMVDFARYPAFRHLLSRTYFGGYAMDRFDVIGDFAQRDHYLTVLSRLLGVELETSLHAHRTPPSDARQQTYADGRITSALRDVLRDDIVFYERWAGRMTG